MDGSRNSRRAISGRIYTGPLIGIAILLAGWFLIAEWEALPRAIASAMASLH